MEVLEIEPDNLDLDNINLPNLKLSSEINNLSDDEDMISTKPSINFGSGIELPAPRISCAIKATPAFANIAPVMSHKYLLLKPALKPIIQYSLLIGNVGL